MSFQLDGYIDVAERIRIARAEYPDMSLQSTIWFDDIGGVPHVICKAWFYRTPDDARPGIGHATEPIPGRTPYTRGSETMNAETSAWGRAIAAVIPFGKVASADEVKAAKTQHPASHKKEPGIGVMDVKIAIARKGATNATEALAMATELLGEPVTDFAKLKAADIKKLWAVLNESK